MSSGDGVHKTGSSKNKGLTTGWLAVILAVGEKVRVGVVGLQKC